MIEWRFHSEYYTHSIQRGYDGPQPKMVYRCVIDSTILEAKNLSGIKAKVKDYAHKEGRV